MSARIPLLTAVLMTVSLAACSEAPKAETSARLLYVTPRLLYVPSASMIASGKPAMRAGDVLPASDGDVFIARGEKFIWGELPVAASSSYTTFTYDAQVISRDQGNVGYRYRWVVQQGISLP